MEASTIMSYPNDPLDIVVLADAHEVPILRKKVVQLREALEEVISFAQEVQRGTDPVQQGDAHLCGGHIERIARAALEQTNEYEISD